MSTLRTVGIISCTAGLLLSSTVVLAQEPNTSNDRNKGAQRGLISTTTPGENAKNARERIKAVREEVQTRITAQRQKVEQRMSEIKDKVKQVQAEKISKQFENLNSNWTDHFMNLLDRYDAIVQKIQDRATIATENGKDITTVTTAIQTAKTAIANARTAVTVQVGKSYTPTVADTATPTQESTIKELRLSFQNLHSFLFNDLFALRDGPMKSAREAVQSALKSLGAIPGVDDDKSATTASTSSPRATENKSNQ
ncbi:hypothetical protein A2609_02600 [Candidatus Kaiserbacteria bacterium RIFOXYD1_FULL_47_14]|uniref:DUF5667 domain-containing protein n=1 Tax=Candidatus Kaiserbacteria bacterium RIFOXYD1_FULL_47_14 TaxID=1798533 RepID=A0A1F6G4W7_9BACT|nr:MAG: hypothetical protein A2609_02600 [Candidatus Kaiserbacteria bacterium RIFOXYD1_FULL_47_14]